MHTLIAVTAKAIVQIATTTNSANRAAPLGKSFGLAVMLSACFADAFGMASTRIRNTGYGGSLRELKALLLRP